MKTSIRWWSRLAFVAGVGLTALTACSSGRPDGQGEEKQSGSLSLALQATAPSGNVYRLRNAFFEIRRMSSGEVVQFLSSEDGLPTDELLTTLLESGDYTVTLFPGWQLERVSGGGGTGGASPGGGSGGTFSGGSGPIPQGGEGGEFDEAPPMGGKAGGGKAGSSGQPDPGAAGAPAEGGAGGSFGTGGSFGSAGSSAGGSMSTGGTAGGGGGTFVAAELLSNVVQVFSIFGRQDAFVHYQFRVGDEVFDMGRLHIGIGVEETQGACVPPPGVSMPERMLLESNVEALGSVSLRSAFEALATNGGHAADADQLFNQVFDSFATAELGRLPDAVHCGDETTDGVATLNGYPITCNRDEMSHVDDIDSFRATAFVNRIDMAPANGAHCGQQRMIFASNSRNRAFVILEAQIPNPAPEQGIDGCRPLAEFWAEQNLIADAKVRGERLTAAFITGTPQLLEAGFGPFYTAENLTVGSGQIRTNTFDSDPWTLREFKLALDNGAMRALPFPVAEAPNGALWNDTIALPQGEACRENFLNAIDGLLTSDLETMSFVVDGACKDAESRADGSQDYVSQLSAGFAAQLEERLSGTGLSAVDIASRAQFAGSCIGCHMEAGGRSLGNGLFAPIQVDFPQVTEFPRACSGGETGDCFPTSQGLQQQFFPTRMLVMSALADFPIIPNPCDGAGGTGGSSGTGGSTGGGGKPGVGGAPPGGSDPGDPTLPPLPGEGEAEPAPVVVIELPSAGEPIEVLQEEEAELRDLYGDVTLSGRSAKATH